MNVADYNEEHKHHIHRQIEETWDGETILGWTAIGNYLIQGLRKIIEDEWRKRRPFE